MNGLESSSIDHVHAMLPEMILYCPKLQTGHVDIGDAKKSSDAVPQWSRVNQKKMENKQGKEENVVFFQRQNKVA